MIIPGHVASICVIIILVLAAGCQCVSRSGPGGTGSGTSGQTDTSGGSSTDVPPDLPAGCRPDLYGECDPWCQDCPEGEKCLPYADDGGVSWNATRCSPIAPSAKAPGEPCSAPEGPTAGVDDCEKGAICWNVDPETNEGTCQELCVGTPASPTCPSGELSDVCHVYNDGVLPLCIAWCNPLKPQPCPSSSDLCLMGTGSADPITIPVDPTAASFQCVLRPETEPQGTPCLYANSCDPALACVDATLVPGCDPNTAAGCCTAWCSLSAPDCPDGTVCAKVLEPHPQLPPEFADLGLCISP